MILKEFPDIHWLKKAISNNFSDRKSWDNRQLPSDGWPTVILQTKTKHAERKDIKGPFSIFMNKSGQSNLTAEGRTVHLNGDVFVTTNDGQHYDLMIDESYPCETFNIHFGDKFYRDALTAMQHSTEKLLDNCRVEGSAINMKIKSSFRSDRFNQLINTTQLYYDTDEKDHVLFELLAYVLQENSKEIARVQSVDHIRKSTREELVARTYLAIDYIHSNYQNHLDLEELASVAMLSKFHFLRVFKSIVNQSPYQYIKHIRLQKAEELLRQSDLPLYLVAQAVGIENGSSLSRMIFQHTGKRPTSFQKEG